MFRKVGVIGGKDDVMPMRSLGWHVEYCEDALQARAALEEMVRNGFGIIYLTEFLAKDMMEVVEKYDSALLPIITIIPSHGQNEGIAKQRASGFVSKAIGKNIL